MRSSIVLPALLLALTSCGSSENRDSTRFIQWQQEGSNKAETAALQSYLSRKGVGAVIPIRQLLRSDTKWRLCGAEPFDVPPKAYWPHMVPTLALIRDEVQPLVGAVEAQSVFRGAEINRCIKGASRSYHLRFHAIDMRPGKGVSRADLIEKLCALHTHKGMALNMGLGIYRGTRFHIDTAGYRRWGHDHRAASSPCTSFVAPQRESR
jgi:Peptidase M15